jgi:hypothetical protein
MGVPSSSLPGVRSRAVAVRDVVLSPVPTAVALALGVDTATFAWGHARARAKTFDPLGFFDPLMKSVREKLAPPHEGGPGGEISPLAALRALLRR